MGIEGLAFSPRSPWQNAYVARVIGSMLRDRSDPITPMGEEHLPRTVGQCTECYSNDRPHEPPEGNSPAAHACEGVGRATEILALGALYHRQSCATEH